MADYWGTRLAVGELSRATNQVAITLATAMGHRRADQLAPTFRTWAAQSMFAALLDSVLPCTLNEFDDYGHGGSGAARLKKEFVKKRDMLHLPATLPEEFHIEVVLVPLDGANALREGRSGALSLIGAARRGCFIGNHFVNGAERTAVGDCYLAIVVGKGALAEERPLNLALKPQRASATEVCAWLRKQELLQVLVRYVRSNVHEPVIGVTYPPDWNQKNRFPLQGCMVRLLEGSTVGAALAALRNKVPAIVCVSRRPQVKLIALATIALQGSLFCVPLEECKDKKGAEFHVPQEVLARHETDFVRKDNGILISSSISEVCFQDRVRFIDQNRVSVNTLIVSLASRSLRDITQELDLGSATFRDPLGKRVIASEELQRFRRDELDVPDE